MSDWQTIESIPRDGKHYLLWLPKAEHMIGLSMKDGGISVIGYFGDDNPTYWKPLATPPSPSKEVRT